MWCVALALMNYKVGYLLHAKTVPITQATGTLWVTGFPLPICSLGTEICPTSQLVARGLGLGVPGDSLQEVVSQG